MHPDDLGLQFEGEHESVPGAVVGLEGELAHGILGDMAVVAGGEAPVAAVLPGGVLRGHDVAVDTGGGIVGQVAGGPGNMEGHRQQSEEGPRGQQDQEVPPLRRPQQAQEGGGQVKEPLHGAATATDPVLPKVSIPAPDIRDKILLCRDISRTLCKMFIYTVRLIIFRNRSNSPVNLHRIAQPRTPTGNS